MNVMNYQTLLSSYLLLTDNDYDNDDHDEAIAYDDDDFMI